MASITAAPFRLDDPSFVIDHDASVLTEANQLKCAGRRIRIFDNDQEFEDVETFCNPGGEAPGLVKLAIILDFLQSFGTAGFWNITKPYEGLLVPFAFLPQSQNVPGETNPEVTGQCWVPHIPFLDAAPGKFTTPQIEFKVYGKPAYNTTATPVYAGHAT